MRQTNPTEKSIFWAILGLFLLNIHGLDLLAKDQEIDHIYYPSARECGNINYSVGVSLTILPRALVDDVIRQVPVLDAQAKIGLPFNISAKTRLNIAYIANQAAIGLEYSYHYKNIAFSVGYEIAYWYGFADLEGFDTEAFGWLNCPFISLGVDLEEALLSAHFNLIFITNQETSVGSTVMKFRKNELTGYAITFAVEQPLWKNNDLLFAVKFNFARSLYQSWLTFSTFDQMLLHPELIIGIVL